MTEYVDQSLTSHSRPEEVPAEWRICVYGLVERNGRILLVDQIVAAGPGLSLPGGGVELDPEETILEGSVREVYEETGYHFEPDAESMELIAEAFIRSPSGRHYHAILFLVRGTVSEDPDPRWARNDEEIVDVLWVDPASLTQHAIRRSHWDALARLGYVLGPA
ncbi:MAG TPA: NUDIX domain-containing protein [Thermomicrobiales bacterium]|nr:NUDIX domain-containing protein [Thermomicrobiales bacterium]